LAATTAITPQNSATRSQRASAVPQAPSALLAPKGVVRIPAISTRVDYEGELGIVIARRCHKIGPDEDVRPYIRGYVCVNDVTARDIQKSDSQWTRGKGFDTFCPVGPSSQTRSTRQAARPSPLSRGSTE